MKILERISGTSVRHDWRSISQGVAEGKSFLVENHGRPEAVISPPVKSRPAGFEARRYFAALKKSAPVPLSAIEIRRAPEI